MNEKSYMCESATKMKQNVCNKCAVLHTYIQVYKHQKQNNLPNFTDNTSKERKKSLLVCCLFISMGIFIHQALISEALYLCQFVTFKNIRVMQKQKYKTTKQTKMYTKGLLLYSLEVKTLLLQNLQIPCLKIIHIHTSTHACACTQAHTQIYKT